MSPGLAPPRVSAVPPGNSPIAVTHSVRGPRVVSPPISSTSYCARERVEAEHECSEPCGIGRWQRAGEQHEARQRTHRREVGQVDGERLVAERPRIGVREEMPALDEHVDRHDVFHAGRRRDDGAVVADADAHVGVARRAAEVALDQLELIHRAPSRRISVGAQHRRELVEHAVDELWPSVPPYAFASSTASSMTTRYGMSSRCVSSHAPITRSARSTGASAASLRSTLRLDRVQQRVVFGADAAPQLASRMRHRPAKRTAAR